MSLHSRDRIATCWHSLAFLVWPCYLFLVPSVVSAPASSQSLTNITIVAPKGTNDHGDPHLLCTPAKWTDIATFFLANYIAHAATVKFDPGESLLIMVTAVISALFFPTSGIMRGLKAIWQRAIFSGSALERASRAGALCMVVRTHDWRPQTGATIKCVLADERLKLGWEPCPGSSIPERHEGKCDSQSSHLQVTLEGQEQERSSLNKSGVEAAKTDAANMEHDGTSMKEINPNAELVEPTKETNPDAELVEPTKETYPDAELVEPTQYYHKLPLLDVHYDGASHGVMFSPAGSGIFSTGRKIYGRCHLPSGYALASLPSGTPVSDHQAAGATIHPHQDRGDNPKQTGGLRGCFRSAYAAVARSVIPVIFPTDMSAIVDDFRHGRVPPMARDDLDFFRRIAGLQHRYPKKPPSAEMELSSSYSFAKAAIAVFQTVFASVTLYRTRGDQVQRYGFAAFGLTVAPYLTMSIVNLFSTLVTPDYPTLYLVRSEIMDESIAQGAKFEGIVGSLIPAVPAPTSTRGEEVTGTIHVESDRRIFIHRQREVLRNGTSTGTGTSMQETAINQGDSSTPDAGLDDVVQEERTEIRLRFWDPLLRPSLEEATLLLPSCPPFQRPPRRLSVSADAYIFLFIAVSMLIGSVPIIINGCLSRFHKGDSTRTQRVWTMIWLVFGVVMGPITSMADHVTMHGLAGSNNNNRANVMRYYTMLYTIGVAIWYAAPAVGGFVVVGKMIAEYGTCTRIY